MLTFDLICDPCAERLRTALVGYVEALEAAVDTACPTCRAVLNDANTARRTGTKPHTLPKTRIAAMRN